MRIVVRKRFGQHFLEDEGILNKIVYAIAAKQDDHLVEIGPGLGALTKKILSVPKRLDLIELDRDFIAQLKKTCSEHSNCFIHEGDVLRFDLNSIYQKKKMRLIGNLPYNISTPLLFHVSDYNNIIEDMHFMLQLEVAERLSAKPHTKAYGRLSVMMQYYWQIEMLFSVAKEAFYPKPKVESAVVRFTPRKRSNEVKDLVFFTAIVRQAFNQRRKTIQNSLKNMITKDDLELLNIDLKARAEDLAVEDFIRIANFR